MRGLTARFMVAGILCATVALGTPLAAYADSTSTTTTTSVGTSGSGTDWMSAESSYVAHRHNIRVNYRTTVNLARNAFTSAMSKARTNRARSAARATLLRTIAAAGADQTAALASLGSGPESSGELDGSQFRLERLAINQDYADAVDAETATYRAEVAAATSSAQLVTARANLRLGIAEATVARSSELVALGSRSLKATKPLKLSGAGTNIVSTTLKGDN